MVLDLKSFIDSLTEREYGGVTWVRKEVNPVDFTLSAILEKLDQTADSPVTIFAKTLNLNGKPSELSLVGNIFASRERCALAMGLEPSTSGVEMIEEFSRREGKTIQPEVINHSDAPVKDIILLGEQADLHYLPVPRFHAKDAGPYHTMMGIIKDRSGDFYDISYVKNLILDARRMTVSLSGRSHLGKMHLRYEEHGESTPIAICLGHHPAFSMGALALHSLGNDDYASIGGFMGQALRLVPSETWGDQFLVPADAEVIIEGCILPAVREMQNPFGEYSRYYQLPKPVPVIEIKAITHRVNAMLQFIFPGHAEHFNLGGIPKEGSILTALRKIHPGVKSVHMAHSGSGRLNCYVSFHPRLPGEAKRIGLVPLTMSAQIQWVVVVDEDVNVFNEEEVIWSMITRTDFDEDFNVIRGYGGYNPDFDDKKMVIDATIPKRDRFPDKNTICPEALKRVRLEEWIEKY